MKKLEIIKTLQLFIFLGLSALCLYLVVKTGIYHLIADSRQLQIICLLLWVSLFVSFIFVFIDFSLYSKQKNDYNALDYAVHSDPLAGIANRQGIDEIIDQYVDAPLPDNMGAAMFLLTSLNEINRNHTRIQGNAQIRSFSTMLKLASVDVAFVGRNGGNVFLAIFSDTDQDKIDGFVNRIRDKVIEYNRDKKNLPMYYQYGVAFREDPPAQTINALISTASKRAHEGETTPGNIRSISSYKKAPLIAAEKTTEVDSTVLKAPEKEVKEEPAMPLINICAETETLKEAPKSTTKIRDDTVDYKYTDEELFGSRDENYMDYYREAI